MPENRERLALRLIAVSFFALAAWVTVDAVRSLLGRATNGPWGTSERKLALSR
jgi:hypothetical protein